MSTEVDETAETIRTIGVLGAGQMGGGIAQVAASSGFAVRVCDTSLEVAEAGLAKVKKALLRQVERGKMSEVMASAVLGRITVVRGPADFAPCDLVVEAATENVDLKIQLFKACDAAIRPGAWLASNSSSISITKLAAATSRADRVIGMHFMNPPPLMKLIEIVRGVQTSNHTYDVITRVCQKMGKTVITSKDVPGFLVNRMLIPLLSEACFALQEGLGTPEDIDTGAKLGLNHPMGPLELADLIGLDTMLFIVEVLHREFGDDKYRAPTLLRNLVAAGWYGKKTGRGFYVYDEKGNKTGRAI
jgi:3-hydroxybutyryl-CoA dehydrogenase